MQSYRSACFEDVGGGGEIIHGRMDSVAIRVDVSNFVKNPWCVFE